MIIILKTSALTSFRCKLEAFLDDQLFNKMLYHYTYLYSTSDRLLTSDYLTARAGDDFRVASMFGSLFKLTVIIYNNFLLIIHFIIKFSDPSVCGD